MQDLRAVSGVTVDGPTLVSPGVVTARVSAPAVTPTLVRPASPTVVAFGTKPTAMATIATGVAVTVNIITTTPTVTSPSSTSRVQVS